MEERINAFIEQLASESVGIDREYLFRQAQTGKSATLFNGII